MRAAHFRCLPPRVDGFPVLKVLCGNPTPQGSSAASPFRFGIPTRRGPARRSFVGNPWGLPSSCRFSACMPRPVMTTAAPPESRPSSARAGPARETDDSFVLASSGFRLSPTAFLNIDEAALGFRECGLPCGLHASLCTLHASCSAPRLPFRKTQVPPPRAQHSVRVGGWLGLARWGLSPHKKRQACLAHKTLFSAPDLSIASLLPYCFQRVF